MIIPDARVVGVMEIDDPRFAIENLSARARVFFIEATSVPSAALTYWQNDRMVRLGHTDAHCAALFAQTGPITPLAQESLQAYVMLVSGHFQGYCRDLYTECSQILTTVVSTGLRTAVQVQFASELKLNAGNPTIENIRKDFERFGFLLDLATADPANPARITQLGHMNYWRNAVAHQRPTRPPPGVPPVLTPWPIFRLGVVHVMDWRLR